MQRLRKAPAILCSSPGSVKGSSLMARSSGGRTGFHSLTRATSGSPPPKSKRKRSPLLLPVFCSRCWCFFFPLEAVAVAVFGPTLLLARSFWVATKKTWKEKRMTARKSAAYMQRSVREISPERVWLMMGMR